MRLVAILGLLGLVVAAACAMPPRELRNFRDYYELVTLDGEPLPVELPNGQVLDSVLCRLSGRSIKHGNFSLYFTYADSEARPPNPRNLRGDFEFQDRTDGSGRWFFEIIIDEKDTSGGGKSGIGTYTPYSATALGLFSSDSLHIRWRRDVLPGEGLSEMVFRRRQRLRN